MSDSLGDWFPAVAPLFLTKDQWAAWPLDCPLRCMPVHVSLGDRGIQTGAILNGTHHMFGALQIALTRTDAEDPTQVSVAVAPVCSKARTRDIRLQFNREKLSRWVDAYPQPGPAMLECTRPSGWAPIGGAHAPTPRTMMEHRRELEESEASPGLQWKAALPLCLTLHGLPLVPEYAWGLIPPCSRAGPDVSWRDDHMYNLARGAVCSSPADLRAAAAERLRAEAAAQRLAAKGHTARQRTAYVVKALHGLRTTAPVPGQRVLPVHDEQAFLQAFQLDSMREPELRNSGISFVHVMVGPGGLPVGLTVEAATHMLGLHGDSRYEVDVLTVDGKDTPRDFFDVVMRYEEPRPELDLPCHIFVAAGDSLTLLCPAANKHKFLFGGYRALLVAIDPPTQFDPACNAIIYCMVPTATPSTASHSEEHKTDHETALFIQPLPPESLAAWRTGTAGPSTPGFPSLHRWLQFPRTNAQYDADFCVHGDDMQDSKKRVLQTEVDTGSGAAADGSGSPKRPRT